MIFPDVRKLKHVVEKYKNLGNYVNFEADQKGQFKMSLLSDRCTLSTHFKDLQATIFRRLDLSGAFEAVICICIGIAKLFYIQLTVDLIRFEYEIIAD